MIDINEKEEKIQNLKKYWGTFIFADPLCCQTNLFSELPLQGKL